MTQLASLLYQREDLNRQLIAAIRRGDPNLNEYQRAVERADEMLDELLQPNPGDHHANLIDQTTDH